MVRKPGLIVFTNVNSFLGGKKWFFDEISQLVMHFEVSIFTHERIPEISKEEVKKYQIECLGSNLKIRLQNLFLITRVYFTPLIKEFFQKKVYKNRYWIKGWLLCLKQIHFYGGSSFFNKIKELNADETIIYFYWGNEAIMLAPILKKIGFNKIVSRFHGFDLYNHRLGGYQPLKERILRSLFMALPISDHGKKYLETVYSKVPLKIRTHYLGTKPLETFPVKINGPLTIVSCSSVIELKRVELIAQVILSCKFPIEWTHIGDGPQYDSVKSIVIQKNNPQIKCELLGWVSPDQIQEIYLSNYFDLFINASTTEGLPVSIMEAFAAKIPVIAPDIGGIAEIVINNYNGKLLKKDFTADDLANAICYFNGLPYNAVNLLRENAFNTFQSKFNIDVNSKKLCDTFLENL